jgi:hypothetical protein
MNKLMNKIKKIFILLMRLVMNILTISTPAKKLTNGMIQAFTTKLLKNKTEKMQKIKFLKNN